MKNLIFIFVALFFIACSQESIVEPIFEKPPDPNGLCIRLFVLEDGIIKYYQFNCHAIHIKDSYNIPSIIFEYPMGDTLFKFNLKQVQSNSLFEYAPDCD